MRLFFEMTQSPSTLAIADGISTSGIADGIFSLECREQLAKSRLKEIEVQTGEY